MRGLTNYHDGLAAESGVEREYCERGGEIAARRWRGKSGEIDLVVRKGSEIVFVEVKKSRDFAKAAERITAGQILRITRAGEEFLATQPMGQLTNTRVDVALVNGQGETQIIENVTL
ncbi:MAG: hypothetical protein GKR98_07305 [Boseongicola sp.]|nr:MAG: hypothetical protein GKR98_07305 [Boseongicola sp.]